MLDGRNISSTKTNLINGYNKNNIVQPQILDKNGNLANNKINHSKNSSKERQMIYVNTHNKTVQSTQLSAGRQSK